jgi:predicted nucleic acid-binding protein
MTRMSAEFLDTNVILYLLDEGPKSVIAEGLIAQSPMISVQVLNETLVNCLRKAGMSGQEAGAFLGSVRALCPVVPLTEDTHDIGRALIERYGFAVYDAMIIAAALQNQCTTLYSEDMYQGLLVEGQLRIVNPFNTMSS